jgi:diguanylate cyclase (GGDEF)-like protein
LIARLEERVRQRTAELERLSLTDPLTGIANRRSFDKCLEVEWDRAIRTQQPLSLVLVDIDCLKGLNDNVGHTAADEALKAVAQCLRKAGQRTSDVAARYGGDEFALILPETSREGATQIAHRVEAMVHSLGFANPGSDLAGLMTVSQGIATASPDRKGTRSSLMLEADRALYKAKQNGRNRIAVSTSAGSGAESIATNQ